MRARLARAVYLALWKHETVCFACGRVVARPCAGHEYGEVVRATRLRRWAPSGLARRVYNRL